MKSDSGFFFNNLDRHSPSSLKNHVTELQKAKSVANDCDVSLFCGLPIFSIRIVPVLWVGCYWKLWFLHTTFRRESTWIPAGKPIIHDPIKLTVNSKENISPTLINYNLTANGRYMNSHSKNNKTETQQAQTIKPSIYHQKKTWNL